MKRYVFGIDIGGTTIKIGLFEVSGKLVEVWEIPTRKEDSGGYILTDIAQSIENKQKEYKISKIEVEGIGVGVPGPVRSDGTVLKCVNLGWGIFNIEKALEALTGFIVKAGNDANVAALGEMWKGGGNGYRDIVMVTLGTGVGGGIVINGQILSGTGGAAGEIGHMPMSDNETEKCNCGKQGCLEQYTSATGIVRMTRKYMEEHPGQLQNLRADCTAKDIFDEARNGNVAAKELVDQVARVLGKGLAQVACIINPEAFVIGGGVARAGEILFEPVRKYYKDYVFHASAQTPILPAELGNNAGIYGCVKLILK